MGIVAILLAIVYIIVPINNARLGVPISTLFVLISVARVTSMILCAVYVFFHYGRMKSTLLGSATAVFASSFIIIILNAILPVISSSRHALVGSSVQEVIIIIVTLMFPLIQILIFALMTVKYLSPKVGINVKALSISAIVASIASYIALIFSFEFIVFHILTLISDYLLPFVPFLLFALFCPLESVSASTGISISKESLRRNQEMQM